MLRQQPPCCHLVQHSAEGEQIAPRIQFFRPRLLWRHISNGAERRTGTGQVVLAIAVSWAVGPAASITLLLTGVTFANPRSRIFACPRSVTKILVGVISR
jgi:hypothetical protein